MSVCHILALVLSVAALLGALAIGLGLLYDYVMRKWDEFHNDL